MSYGRGIVKRKRITIALSIIGILLLVFSAYQVETEPINAPTINKTGGYSILKTQTNSEIVNSTIAVLSSSEGLTMGIDIQKNITESVMMGIPLIVAETFQSKSFPFNSMTYVIKGVNLFFNNSNQSVPITGPISKTGYSMYLITYSFNLLGNFSLIFYVTVSAIDEFAIYHYTGNTFVIAIHFNFNVSVTK